MIYVKTFFRLLLGLFMTYAGISHLTYVAIFPGNINQYVNHISAFGLDTDQARLIRLFFQPLLIFLALWSTGGWQQLKEWWKCIKK